jgi:hypothetical protein
MRDEVRAALGEPTLTDTPALHVYDWEKAEAVGAGSSLPVPFGHKGTRALFVFDEGGRLVRTQVRGTGQDDTAGAEGSATPPPVPAPAVPAPGDCGTKGVVRAWLAGHGPWLMVQRRDEVQVCALPGAEPVGSLPGGFLDAGVSADGRLAASFDRKGRLTLLQLPTLAVQREFQPSSGPGLHALRRWGAAISLSADGGRVAAAIGDHGVSVYESSSGGSVLRLDGRWGPVLSPDGRLLVSKAESGLSVTDVDRGGTSSRDRSPGIHTR